MERDRERARRRREIRPAKCLAGKKLQIAVKSDEGVKWSCLSLHCECLRGQGEPDLIRISVDVSLEILQMVV